MIHLKQLMTERFAIKRDGKYKMDDVFVTKTNEYNIDGYGNKTAAYADYNVSDKKGNEYTMRIGIKFGSTVRLLPKPLTNWDDYRKVVDITYDLIRIK